jgi:hypothetical protein
MKEKNDLPTRVLDQLEAAPLLVTEDLGFGYDASNCSGCGGGSCRSCGGGCYGCYTPSDSKSESASSVPRLLR